MVHALALAAALALLEPIATPAPITPEVIPPPAISRPLPATPAVNALAEVNAARAARGLPPYAEDPGLAAAAAAAAAHRAQVCCQGHTGNDFGFLPRGIIAHAAGCAAWPIDAGWGSCCTYDSARYAGAAAAIGADGRRYMHLFVRDGDAAPGQACTTCTQCTECTTGERRPRILDRLFRRR